MQRALILIGLLLLALGLLWPWLSRWGFFHLPGDLVIKRGEVRIYLPITTMFILSLVLSVLLSIFFRK